MGQDGGGQGGNSGSNRFMYAFTRTHSQTVLKLGSREDRVPATGNRPGYIGSAGRRW